MGEFVFKVSIVAVVRVRAADENVARNIVPDVLGAPGAAEIALANQKHAAFGRDATVTDVDFDVGSIKLANGRSVRPLAFVENNSLHCCRGWRASAIHRPRLPGSHRGPKLDKLDLGTHTKENEGGWP